MNEKCRFNKLTFITERLFQTDNNVGGLVLDISLMKWTTGSYQQAIELLYCPVFCLAVASDWSAEKCYKIF